MEAGGPARFSRFWVEITFDRVKNARNIRARGLPFERVAELAFDTAL